PGGLLACFYSYFCADAGSVRNPSDASHRQPVVAISIVPIKQIVLSIEIGDEQIDKAIIVVISPGASVAHRGVTHHAAGRNFRERPVAVVMIQKIVLA